MDTAFLTGLRSRLSGLVRPGGGLDNFLRKPSLWWGLIAVWLALAGASYAWRVSELTEHASEMASQRGRLVYEMIETTRLWAANHGGVYGPVTPQTPPNPYLDVPDKVISTPSGKSLTKINPAYMTRQLGELIASDTDLRIHLTSLKPINPGNTPDDWERESLEGFENKRDARVSIVGAGGTATFRYMAPLEVKQACLACHEKQGYRLGDIRGGLSVSFPASYVLDIIDAHKRDHLIVHAVAFILLAGVSWVGLSLIRGHLLALEAAHVQLSENEKMASLGRMVAGFSHELNTPVGVALGAASQAHEVVSELRFMVQDEEVDEKQLASRLTVLDESADLMVRNLRRAAAMVQSFKRIAVDQSSEADRDFSLRELVDDVVRNHASEFKRGTIEIRVDCPPELHMHGAAGALEQLLTNLLGNARVHGFGDRDAGGVISIALRRLGQTMELVFDDDGRGMQEQEATRAFEPFFTTRRGKGGSGLGLYLVHTLVTRKLNGTIELHTQPGRGTRFVVRWPWHAPKETP